MDLSFILIFSLLGFFDIAYFGIEERTLLVGLIWSLIWPSSFSSFFNVLVYHPVGSEFSEDKFVAKIKMEIVVSKDQV